MLKLMIVDDDVIIREGLKKSFDWNSLGYEIVAESDNGIDAIDLYYETLPDVIITDIYIYIYICKAATVLNLLKA